VRTAATSAASFTSRWLSTQRFTGRNSMPSSFSVSVW